MDDLLNFYNLIFPAIVILAVVISILRFKRIFTKYKPELFLRKEMEKGADGYAKWLKKEYNFWRASLLSRKYNVSASLLLGVKKTPFAGIEKIKMLEQEMERVEKQYGLPLFDDQKKLSEEINQRSF